MNLESDLWKWELERKFRSYYRYGEVTRDRRGNGDWIEESRMEMVLKNINRCIKRIEGDEVIMGYKMGNRES